MNQRSFIKDLEMSRGIVCATDLATIQSMIPGCKDVRIATISQDKAGTDYIATLRGGAEILIDGKTREKGVRAKWRNHHIPELALEKWSVIPNSSCPNGKVGWSLCETKQTDMVLYTFNPADSLTCFLFPFQHLRMAFRKNIKYLYANFKVAPQSSQHGSHSWQSECVFVPENILWNLIEKESVKTFSEAIGEGNPRDEIQLSFGL